MYILLVEDEDPKRRHIATFISEIAPTAVLQVARSVRSALDRFEDGVPDVVLLDMSLPTFDVGGNEGGGRPQGFGGLELMRNMELEGIECPVVVITGYDAFTKLGGQMNLDALNAQLSEAHPKIFKALFHYNSAYGDWQEKVRSILIDLGVISENPAG
jgi:CheY-like chemotaxis protein